jgi:hypothetical protein
MKEGTVQSSSRFNIFWKNPEPYYGPTWLTSTHIGTGVIRVAGCLEQLRDVYLFLNGTPVVPTEYTQSGNGRFLAYIAS